MSTERIIALRLHRYRCDSLQNWLAAITLAQLVAVASSSLCFGDESELEVLFIDKRGTLVEVVWTPPESVLDSLKIGAVDQQIGHRFLTLAVVENQQAKSSGSILGSYRRRNDQLVFSPRYRLVPGSLYRATVILPAGTSVRRHFTTTQQPSGQPAEVTAIFPSSTKLPANVLKFYIQFSQPMREGKAIFDQIVIVDDAGQLVHDPWRRMELWNNDATRITLWIHPGRVKKGVNLREDFGPVLEPGKTYQLKITQKILDAQGHPLSKTHIKRFTAVAEDHQRPLPQHWKLTIPPADSNEPLTVQFYKSLDRPLALRYLTIRDPIGRVVTGEGHLNKDESVWQFQPKKPWTTGSYQLSVDPLLEDVAGNTPVRHFQVDLRAKTSGESPQLTLRFEIR